MYDIRQFRPILYLLIFTGITGFALAAESEAIWVLGTTAILLNAWLVHTRRFSPLPRLLANAITIVAGLYAYMNWQNGVTASGGSTSIISVAQFLVVLQLVKLYEQRGNRDYAQLLVLSLLLMVAAAISTYKLEFGILFIIYMFLALYACLLFHLKVETDHAKIAIGVPEEKLNPMTLRQDQRYLPRSMRRLTILVAIISVTMAVIVFVFFPRNTGAGLFGPVQTRQSQALTGFSDQMNFQQVAQITQNQAIVAYVKLWDDGQPIEGSRPLLLRGATLEVYTGDSLNWQWQHRGGGSATEKVFESLEPQHTISIDGVSETGHLRQEIMLEPTGTEALFALPGVTDVRPITPVSNETRLRFQARDQTLRIEPLNDKTFRYEVFSSGTLTARNGTVTRPTRAANRSSIDPKIEAYARKPDVSGEDSTGPLAPRRPKDQLVTPLDELIAGNIAKHLMGEDFSYTLDLSDAQRVQDRDPVVAFLYDLKRGHCEYFAGAMTLMCQSLGMQARVVLGFKCDEFNTMTHSYVVRQSHAHAWVEVLNDQRQWVTFDPTSGREAPNATKRGGLWNRAKQILDYLEYTWANSVVAYDRDSRTSMIQNVDAALGNSANTTLESVKSAREWFKFKSFLNAMFFSNVISILIWILMIILLAAVSWFALERWRLRRRAKRIGLNTLPAETQLRLARQLGFYDDLLRLLAKRNIVPGEHLTPMEFSQSLSFLPNETFDTIRRLTQIFYRIRYGQTEISATQQRRLKSAIDRVEALFDRLST